MKNYFIIVLMVCLTLLSGCDQRPEEKAKIIQDNLNYKQAQAETYKRSVSFCQGEINIQDSRVSDWDGSRLTTCTDGRNLKLNYREFLDCSQR